MEKAPEPSNTSSRTGSTLSRFDWLFDRVYTSRYNPLYQSGVLAVFLLMVVTLTGFYLLFFYKISDPYASLQRIDAQAWLGSWIRALHHYASDAAVVAVAVHIIRMAVQKRSWGPRLLAWISGIILTGIMLFCGWTGLMLVWDVQGQVMAKEIAQVLDLFPIFAEPLQRAFENPHGLPEAFFFLNLFMHVSLPLGMIFLFWLHTAKLARVTLLPPKKLMAGTLLSLLILSVAYPPLIGVQAHALQIPGRIPIDWFYNFWLPLALKVSPVVHMLLWIIGLLALALIPLFTRPTGTSRPSPSFVNEKSCTGCTSCYMDCPFDAIQMVPRTVGFGSAEVAQVDPNRCVSCGICAASCDPMGVGPAGRTGKDQLKAVDAFFGEHKPGPADIVVMSCMKGIGDSETLRRLSNVKLYPISCAGNLHMTVIEYLIRKGAGGILILSCPPRNCSSREGVKWLQARVYEGHDSELRSIVDRRRLRIAPHNRFDITQACADIEEFRKTILALGPVPREDEVTLDLECETTETQSG